jgi:hypothetical protein
VPVAQLAAVGAAVRKRGRTTGLTFGTVDTVDLTLTLDYGGGIGNRTLSRQVGIKADTSRSAQFGGPGDSGSVVVDGANRVVGLYFAGFDGAGYGVANPIGPVLSALGVGLCRTATTPLYRYWNPAVGDHFYTTNWAELNAGRGGFALDGVQCRIYPSPAAGTVALHRYWNPGVTDHFYTADFNELGMGRYGWPATAGMLSTQVPEVDGEEVPVTFRAGRIDWLRAPDPDAPETFAARG